ncbi:MAG: UvrD-helicase domain-containing protein [Puniceicoccales bacterium]|jgi:ATP-dependent exoDNAse (exonuclease V) beta subunit|nr:UvrD-helicase domain-containing protein [Puniceicoccales bacterium]
MQLSLIDEPERLRFIHELDRNFSIIAPAGVGKTTAIASRVVEWLRSFPKDNLPHNFNEDFSLFVVTYTEKAAQELEQRVKKLLCEDAPAIALKMFERLPSIFFGTIHSLADKFLHSYGISLGLSPRFKVNPEPRKLWHSFLHETHDLFDHIPPEVFQGLRSHYYLSELLPLVPCSPYFREYALWLQKNSDKASSKRPFPAPPILNLDSALSFKAKGNAGCILQFQKRLQNWLNPEQEEPFPEIETTNQNFLAVLLPEMQKYWQWSDQAVRTYFADIQERYLRYRIREGQLFYEDLIFLAHRCMGEENIAKAIPTYRVLLDEAQDTDQYQFEWLLSLASSRRCPWELPEPGYFCMVGDPQQSIYCERAALPYYRELHRHFLDKGKANELHFSVTMRCPKSLVDFINRHFKNILTGTEGQVPFVPLQAKPNAIQGTIHQWIISSGKDCPFKDADAALEEAKMIAKTFQYRQPSDFGARRWSDIAFLCPRNKWLQELTQAFLSLPGTPTCQLHSQKHLHRDSPFYAWVTALMIAILEPRNDFEITGILRELFGISDTRIAQHFALHREDPEIREIGEGFRKDYTEVLGYSPMEFLEYVLQRYEVMARLEAIFGQGFDSEYEAFRDLAQDATYHRMALDTWLQKLISQLHEERSEDAINPEALQFLSFHKSKGLEWPIVIIPFLYRERREPTLPYPKCISTQQGPRIVFNKYHMSEFEDEIKRKQIQNEERLFYVALTRAKEQLILLRDGSLFQKHSGSIGEIFSSSSSSPWDDLPEWNPSKIDDQISDSSNNTIFLSHKKIAPFSPSTTAIDPHGQPPELPQEPYILEHHTASEWKIFNPTDHHLHETSLSFAINYGNWWHQTMAHIPWVKGKSHWNSAFQASLPSSPDRDKALDEWERFLHSDLAAQLQIHHDMIWTEYPFLWSHSEKNCLEGVIDLLAIGIQSSIVDWKTDPCSSEDLKTHYRGQLNCYRQAMEQQWQRPFMAYIYSTVHAQLLLID